MNQRLLEAAGSARGRMTPIRSAARK